jgi:HlyD family secretion protein
VAVRSPVAGRVLKIPHKSEGPVGAGEALIEIGDPRALEVEVDLLSADAVRVHPGTRVLFERWGGDGPLQGEVKRVEPAGFTKISALGVEEQRVWAIVAFTSPRPAWQRLGDGYRVEASFIVWSGRDVLQVPASALFRDRAQWAAYVVESGRARKRRLRPGAGNGLQTQVLSGIAAGERVIAHPDDRVHEGARVESAR